MAENKGLSDAWLNEDEDVEEDVESVYSSGSESPFIQGYGATDTKIVMAKKINFKGKKTEFIEIDFINKEGKTHREKFMVRGKDGKSFFTKDKRKRQHFGVSKIKSLLKVVGLYAEESNLMAALYSNTEEADVTWEEYGKEKTEEFTIFTDLIDKKVKLCITSKKENTQMNCDQDDEDDQKYVNQCIKDTEAYKKAHPKKKSLKKFTKDDEYVNVYRYFVVSTVAHFCSTEGLFGSEIEDGQGSLLDKFLEQNDEGEVFEGRTLVADELKESQLKKLGINIYGKQVEEDEDEYDDVEEEIEDEEEEVPEKKTKAKSDDGDVDDWD